MKAQIIRTLSVSLLAAASVFAQGSQILTVQIPFGFHVGKSILPAGGYIVDTTMQGVLRLKSHDSKSSVMVLTHGVEKFKATDDGWLIFNKYRDEYFLSQAWKPGNHTGSELTKTKHEFEAAAAARRRVESIVAKK